MTQANHALYCELLYLLDDIIKAILMTQANHAWYCELSYLLDDMI